MAKILYRLLFRGSIFYTFFFIQLYCMLICNFARGTLYPLFEKARERAVCSDLWKEPISDIPYKPSHGRAMGKGREKACGRSVCRTVVGRGSERRKACLPYRMERRLSFWRTMKDKQLCQRRTGPRLLV